MFNNFETVATSVAIDFGAVDLFWAVSGRMRHVFFLQTLSALVVTGFEKKPLSSQDFQGLFAHLSTNLKP